MSANKAAAFIEQNQPFVEDGGPSTLQRIVIDGSHILIELGKELQEATQALTRNQWALVDATEKKASTRTLHALEVEERRLRRTLAAKKESHERFEAFWNRTNEAYRERLGDGTEANALPGVHAHLLDMPSLPHDHYSSHDHTDAFKRFFSRVFG